MSNYNMSHTGAQLDDAINKVQSGYIYPAGDKNITANGTVDVKSFANAVVNVPVPSGYIIPTGNKSITANGTFDVKNYANAVVNVPAPSGYINGAGLTLYVSRYNSGVFSPNGNTTMNNISIAVGFKPKIFVLHHTSAITSTGTSGADAIVSASETICDNNYNIIQSHSQVIYFYKATLASGCYARGGQSSSRYFSPTSNGVQGVGSDYYLGDDKNYTWYAWG